MFYSKIKNNRYRPQRIFQASENDFNLKSNNKTNKKFQ